MAVSKRQLKRGQSNRETAYGKGWERRMRAERGGRERSVGAEWGIEEFRI